MYIGKSGIFQRQEDTSNKLPGEKSISKSLRTDQYLQGQQAICKLYSRTFIPTLVTDCNDI